MAIKRQIGLKDFTVAPLTKDNAGEKSTYGEVLKIPGIISAKISIERGSDKIFSDDTTEDVINYLSSISVEIEVANLSAKERQALLGQTVQKGVVGASVNDVAKEVGIMFRSKKTNGKYRYISIPKGKFSEPSENYATKTDGTTAQTITMTFTGMPLNYNGIYKITADEDEEGIDTSYISTFLDNMKFELPSLGVGAASSASTMAGVKIDKAKENVE